MQKKSKEWAAAKPSSMAALRIALTSYDLDIIDLNDPEQVQKRIRWYFDKCAEEDVRPCVSGIAGALGITTSTLKYYAQGIVPAKNPELAVIAARAINVIEQLADSGMMNADIHPVAAIFELTNAAPQAWKNTNEASKQIAPPQFNPAEIPTDQLRARYITADIQKKPGD